MRISCWLWCGGEVLWDRIDKLVKQSNLIVMDILTNSSKASVPVWNTQTMPRRAFVTGVLGLIMAWWVEAWNIERFETVWNMRRITVSWHNLDAIHSIAANNFTKKLEQDFKNPNKFYGAKNFYTDVRRIWNGYEFVYSLELVPALSHQPHFRVIQVMGTVYHDRDAERKVKNINWQKIPRWQSSMTQKYRWMQYLIAESKKWDVYHEAVLGLWN